MEIQVRTRLQDLCAQALEKLADRVGRGIRYGEPPLVQVVDGIDVAQFVEAALSMSATVHSLEQSLVETHEIQVLLRLAEASKDGEARRQQVKGPKLLLVELQSRLSAHEASLREWLLDFVRILE